MPKKPSLSYKTSGVDVAATDKAKKDMAKALETNDTRVLNSIGAFASLYDASFPDYDHPVLVLKTEEPGSKQKIAAQYRRMDGVCQDMINHLINDIAVMGATPLSVQDAVITAKADPQALNDIVAAISAACKAQGCVLTGGETSIQPGVVEPGVFILTASIVGVVEKSKIIDGSTIRPGDTVLAIPSNGLHTNGYSLVRKLMEENPSILDKSVEGDTFLDAILRPHLCYYQGLKNIFDHPSLHGLAHITGGGIEGNLNRILPKGTAAVIDKESIRIPPIFRIIQEEGNVPEDDMLKTFNMGVGLTIVTDPKGAADLQMILRDAGFDSYPIGKIVEGEQTVTYSGKALQW